MAKEAQTMWDNIDGQTIGLIQLIIKDYVLYKVDALVAAAEADAVDHYTMT